MKSIRSYAGGLMLLAPAVSEADDKKSGFAFGPAILLVYGAFLAGVIGMAFVIVPTASTWLTAITISWRLPAVPTPAIAASPRRPTK